MICHVKLLLLTDCFQFWFSLRSNFLIAYLILYCCSLALLKSFTKTRYNYTSLHTVVTFQCMDLNVWFLLFFFFLLSIFYLEFHSRPKQHSIQLDTGINESHRIDVLKKTPLCQSYRLFTFFSAL